MAARKSAGKKKSGASKSSKKSGKKKGGKRSSPGILNKAKKTIKQVLVGAAAGAAKGAVSGAAEAGSKATGIGDAGSGGQRPSKGINPVQHSEGKAAKKPAQRKSAKKR